MADKNIFKIMNSYLPPILYAGMIFLLSSRSYDTISLKHGMDKAAHLILYLGLGYVVLRALRKSGRESGADHWALWIALFYGMTDEYHQSFVPGRQPDMMDILYDGLGGFLSVVFCRIADRQRWPIWF